MIDKWWIKPQPTPQLVKSITPDNWWLTPSLGANAGFLWRAIARHGAATPVGQKAVVSTSNLDGTTRKPLCGSQPRAPNARIMCGSIAGYEWLWGVTAARSSGSYVAQVRHNVDAIVTKADSVLWHSSVTVKLWQNCAFLSDCYRWENTGVFSDEGLIKYAVRLVQLNDHLKSVSLLLWNTLSIYQSSLVGRVALISINLVAVSFNIWWSHQQ